MSSSRIILCGVALATFAVAAFAFDKAPDPIDRMVEYEKSTHVFEGAVAKLTLLDDKDQPDSKGTRYTLDLTLAVVHKPAKQDKLKKGDVVAIQGRTTDGKTKYVIPAEKDEVVAFVTKNKAGKYEALEPKGYLPLSSGGRSKALSDGPAPPTKEKKEEKDK